MCFSAEASFGASVILFAIGALSISKATTIPQKILASIPIIFGVQQFAEGILWLSLSHSSLAYWDKLATYAFLIFAQVVWPIIVPLSVMLLEKNKHNLKILKGLFALGILVGSYLTYCLLFYKVNASISCSHILYDQDFPTFIKHSGIFYLIATVVPPIVSSIKRLRLLGIIILVSYLITQFFYKDYLVSVWCFFAAIISVVVLSVIIRLNRNAAS
ncbi:MAG: hypothetical protein P4L41_08785 [Flavipsychrobacter sp.]|nr:hypothetical protein [Flavipsychrobacter sp.]